MLRQVALEVDSENVLQDAARGHDVKLTVTDCKPFNMKGMTLLLELRGAPRGVKDTITEIRKTPGVRQAIEGEGLGDTFPLLVILDRPATCRASNDSAIVCLECPLSSENQPASWRFIIRKSSDLRQILSRLERDGVNARIEDVSPLGPRPTLTGRQKEIVAIAVSSGYFEFPRRTSLTQLSEKVGVRPSTLSEILRGAERRVMEGAFSTPVQE